MKVLWSGVKEAVGMALLGVAIMSLIGGRWWR